MMKQPMLTHTTLRKQKQRSGRSSSLGYKFDMNWLIEVGRLRCWSTAAAMAIGWWDNSIDWLQQGHDDSYLKNTQKNEKTTPFLLKFVWLPEVNGRVRVENHDSKNTVIICKRYFWMYFTKCFSFFVFRFLNFRFYFFMIRCLHGFVLFLFCKIALKFFSTVHLRYSLDKELFGGNVIASWNKDVIATIRLFMLTKSKRILVYLFTYSS